jgi:hypothetical protein
MAMTRQELLNQIKAQLAARAAGLNSWSAASAAFAGLPQANAVVGSCKYPVAGAPDGCVDGVTKTECDSLGGTWDSTKTCAQR